MCLSIIQDQLNKRILYKHTSHGRLLVVTTHFVVVPLHCNVIIRFERHVKREIALTNILEGVSGPRELS